MATYQPPILHNGVLNTTFNTTDYSNTNSSAYLPIKGGVLTGSLGGVSATFIGTLNANSVVSQTPYSLPTTYSAVPTSSQIGGIVSATTPSAGTAISSATLTTMATFTNLPAGSYSILANIPVAATSTVSLTNSQVSVSTSNAAHDLTSSVVSYASQSLVNGSTPTFQVQRIVQLTTATTLYVLGTFTATGLQTSASARATAFRLG